MYRVQKSMYLKNRLARLKGRVTTRTMGRANSTNGTQQDTNTKSDDLHSESNQIPSISLVNDGKAWLGRQKTPPWQNGNDTQSNSLMQVEPSCSSTSSRPQNPNKHEQIPVNDVRVIMDINNAEVERVKAQSMATDFPNQSSNSSEHLRDTSKDFLQKGHKTESQHSENIVKSGTSNGSTPKPSKVYKVCNDTSSQQQKAKVPDTTVQAKELAKSTPNSKEKKPRKYIFDTRNPSAYEEPNVMQITFGDFENFDEEFQFSMPIRNPRDPPCDMASNSEQFFCSKLTNESIQTQVGSGSPKISLEERLRKQIATLKAGQLSVNQLFVLDIVEDQLAQHEAYLNGKSIARRMGFFECHTRNKILTNRPAGTESFGVQTSTSTRMVTSQQPPSSSSSSPSLPSIPSSPVSSRTKSNSPEKNIVSVKETNSVEISETTDKKKRRRRKKNQKVVDEEPDDGGKINVEVELQVNQKLYEIREVRPKSCTGNGSPQSIYFMKEIRVVENDVYDQLAEETKIAENDTNELHQISEETTERVDRILEKSSASEIKAYNEDPTQWMDDLTYAHIRDFITQPCEEPRKKNQKNSNSNVKKSNKTACVSKLSKKDTVEVSGNSKSTSASGEPKNKKKTKFNQRR